MCKCACEGRYSECCGRRRLPTLDSQFPSQFGKDLDDPTDGYRNLRETEPVWGSCTLAVRFLDGSYYEYKDIRFLARTDTDATNPITVDGSTLTVENDDQSITILGVRHFTMKF
jgi:hypothetical protein